MIVWIIQSWKWKDHSQFEVISDNNNYLIYGKNSYNLNIKKLSSLIL